MFRRTADPLELARTSKLVAAWKRRTEEKAAGDDLADEHWFAHLLTIARPVPSPLCYACDDSGMEPRECTITARCASRICQHSDRRSDPDWSHTYTRACGCEKGQQYQASFRRVYENKHDAPSSAPKTSYGTGFRKAGA